MLNDGLVSVFLGNGDGTFQPRIDSSNGVAYGGSLALGDFNGDGLPDLAITDQSYSGTLAISLGNGDGTFRFLNRYTLPFTPDAVTVGDFNRDGKLDLAVAQGTSQGAVSILLGLGDGSFQAPVQFRTNHYPGSVIAADFDGDGILDLAVGSSSSTSILLGNGDGTFQTHMDHVGGAYALTTADFDGDGRPDLATTAGTTLVSVLLNKRPAQRISKPPSITSVFPPTATQGATIPNFTVTGSNFDPNAKLSLSGTGIAVNSYSSRTATQIVASVAVAANAPVGPQDVVVTNPNGQHGVEPSAFQVLGVPAITVSPVQITFPPTFINTTSVPVTVTVSNPGTAMLLISDISTQDPFKLQSFSSNITTGIAPNTSGTFDTTFSPTGQGPYSGSVSIISNAPSSPTTVPVQGKGILPPPIVSAVSPSYGEQGLTIQNFAVSGLNFMSGSTLLFSGSGISINSYVSRSSTQIVAIISIASPTTPGLRDVVVVNPDMQTITATGIFTVGKEFLMFPLHGSSPGVNAHLTPYNTLINSIFDHSMRDSTGAYHVYGCDSNVEAYTGELGKLDPSRILIGCERGYAQTHKIHIPFYVNGHYAGGGDQGRLYYDGHPGIDYQAIFGTEVYAATDGVIHYPTKADLTAQLESVVGNYDPDQFGILELDPNNGYKIFYLHLSTHPRTISLHLTADAVNQDFSATKIGKTQRPSPGVFGPPTSLSIRGTVLSSGNPLAGAHIELVGSTESKACVGPLTVKTDLGGHYQFSGLAVGYYHIRAYLTGYVMSATTSGALVQEGTKVTVAEAKPIALTGNAGATCLQPHLHFEVQKTSSVVSGLSFLATDPYGWDDDASQDPYETVPGVKNDRLWSYLPALEGINPTAFSAGTVELTLTGHGFDAGVVDCLIKVGSYNSCIQGTVASRSETQLVVRETLASGTYIVHVQNGDGRRSNWKRLLIQ